MRGVRAHATTGQLRLSPAAAPPCALTSVVFAAYTAIAMLLIGYRYLDDLSRQRSGTLDRVLEGHRRLHGFLSFATDPCARRCLPIPQKLARIIVYHLAAASHFSAAHTTLMLVTRKIIAPLVGLGQYDTASCGTATDGILE